MVAGKKWSHKRDKTPNNATQRKFEEEGKNQNAKYIPLNIGQFLYLAGFVWFVFFLRSIFSYFKIKIKVKDLTFLFAIISGRQMRQDTLLWREGGPGGALIIARCAKNIISLKNIYPWSSFWLAWNRSCGRCRPWWICPSRSSSPASSIQPLKLWSSGCLFILFSAASIEALPFPHPFGHEY